MCVWQATAWPNQVCKLACITHVCTHAHRVWDTHNQPPHDYTLTTVRIMLQVTKKIFNYGIQGNSSQELTSIPSTILATQAYKKRFHRNKKDARMAVINKVHIQVWNIFFFPLQCGGHSLVWRVQHHWRQCFSHQHGVMPLIPPSPFVFGILRARACSFFSGSSVSTAIHNGGSGKLV